MFDNRTYLLHAAAVSSSPSVAADVGLLPLATPADLMELTRWLSCHVLRPRSQRKVTEMQAPETRLTRNPSVKARDEEFGKLLVAPGLPMLAINDDGVSIWNLCDGTRTFADIVKACAAREPKRDRADIEQAVDGFISEAIRLGLIAANSSG